MWQYNRIQDSLGGNGMPKVSNLPTSSQRIRAYLDGQIREGSLKAGAQLPPVRFLSRQLGVSTATVFSVYKELAREGVVEGGVGRGTFLKESAPTPRRLCFALNTPATPPQSDGPSGSLLMEGILHAASASPERISVLPLGNSAVGEKAIVQELEEEMDRVDGLLFLPGRQMSPPLYHHISSLYEKAGKPVVCLTQPYPTATANFVTSDHFGSAYRLTRAWMQAGRKRIVYVSTRNTRFTITNFSRPWAAQYVIEQMNAADVTLETLYAASNGEEAGFEVMKAFLEGGGEVDAIFCFGDWLALGAIRALQEHNVSIPKQVSIVGGSGMNLEGTLRPEMTRFLQPVRKVGEAAFRLLTERIRLEGIALPGVLLPMDFFFGDTTTGAENALLKDTLNESIQ